MITAKDQVADETVSGEITPRESGIWPYTFHADLEGDGSEIWQIPCEIDGDYLVTPDDWQSPGLWEDPLCQRISLLILEEER